MRLNKKKVFIAALSVSLLATVSAGSLAWFTAQDEVTNTFYVTNSNETDPNEIFSVDVWENTPETDAFTGTDYLYEDILPGDELKKEVYVENTGYYDQYIRVTVTVSDAEAWKSVLGTTEVPALQDIVDGFDASVWSDTSAAIVNDEIVYTLYYSNILLGDQASSYDDDAANQEMVMVFSGVKIPESMEVADAVAFENDFEINVFAEAVQTENLGLDLENGDGAAEAFAVIG